MLEDVFLVNIVVFVQVVVFHILPITISSVNAATIGYFEVGKPLVNLQYIIGDKMVPCISQHEPNT